VKFFIAKRLAPAVWALPDRLSTDTLGAALYRHQEATAGHGHRASKRAG
jgi:hypothetical protein